MVVSTPRRVWREYVAVQLYLLLRVAPLCAFAWSNAARATASLGWWTLAVGVTLLLVAVQLRDVWCAIARLARLRAECPIGILAGESRLHAQGSRRRTANASLAHG